MGFLEEDDEVYKDVAEAFVILAGMNYQDWSHTTKPADQLNQDVDHDLTLPEEARSIKTSHMKQAVDIYFYDHPKACMARVVKLRRPTRFWKGKMTVRVIPR